MVIIKNEARGAVLKLVEDGNTTYMYFTDLVNKIWDDYVRSVIGNVYTRGLLKDLQFTDIQVFHMLEELQVGRTEFIKNDYEEVSYQ
jgi:hypothetical protein